MLSNELQFAISQYLDGTLPADEVAALQRRLESDAEARALLAEYRALDAALRAGGVPAVDLAAIPAHVDRGEVTGQYAEESAVDQEMELAIAQLVDGTLAGEQRGQVEQVMAENPAARRVCEEERALDAMLQQLLPLPPVKWEALAAHLSEAVEDQAVSQRMSLRWLRSGPMMALAASVVVAIGVGIIIFVSGQKPVAAARVAQISGPEAEAPDGAAVVEISIERPEALASSPYDHYSSGVVSLPQRIELVSFTAPVREDSVPPF